MLIKLNCFSIKRNIYEDAASTADLLVFCKQTDFLTSPPSRNLPSSARLLHLSFVSVCFVVSFQGAERTSPSPAAPRQPPQHAAVSVLLRCIWLLSLATF